MRNALAGVERALFWTLAFAAFAAVAAGLGARVADHLAIAYEQARAGYAIVRVLAPEGEEGTAAATRALATAPHVDSAAPMTAGRAAALLTEWGGTPIDPADIPPLSLIEIELAPTGEAADAAGDIEAALAQGGVTAEVIAAPSGVGGGGIAERVRTLALWGAIGFAALMALIIWLAARGIAARRREVVTVMTDLGATRSQASARIADEAGMLGLFAGLVGALLAAAAVFVALLLAVPGVTPETLAAMIRPVDLIPIAAAPLACAIAARAGARSAAAYFHGQAARLG